jgi:hypothetical protein
VQQIAITLIKTLQGHTAELEYQSNSFTASIETTIKQYKGISN